MCNQAAALSRCLTKEKDSMVTQFKSLRVDTRKGKAAERTQQAVEELEYLVTFNRFTSNAAYNAGSLRDVQHQFILTHCFRTVCWSRLKMKFPVVKRGILLAVCTGNLDIFIRTFPQMADQNNNQSGSPLHRPGSKLGTGKLDRKVVVKPQTSPKSRPRVSRNVNDNYCVLNVAVVKNSVHVSGKKQVLNRFTSDKKETDCSFTCKRKV